MLFVRDGIDTLKIARAVHRDLPSRSLGELCDHYQIENAAAHRAYHDALATAKLYQTMAHYYEETEPLVFRPAPFSICGKTESKGHEKTAGSVDASDKAEEAGTGLGPGDTDGCRGLQKD